MSDEQDMVDYSSVPQKLILAYSMGDWQTLIDYWEGELTPITVEEFVPDHPLFMVAYILVAWLDAIALRDLMSPAQVEATQQRLRERLCEESPAMVA